MGLNAWVGGWSSGEWRRHMGMGGRAGVGVMDRAVIGTQFPTYGD